MNRFKKGIENLRISEDGKMPVDMQIARMLQKQGKTISDMDRNLIKQMLASGNSPEVVIKTILGQSGRTMSNMDRQMIGRTMSDMDRQMMAGGGTPFPDLNNDGETTYADILKGRGVYAQGGEAIDVNNISEELKEKVENIYRKLYLNPEKGGTFKAMPATASLTDEERAIYDSYLKGKMQRDAPLLSKYMDMIGFGPGMEDDSTGKNIARVMSTFVAAPFSMGVSSIRDKLNPELGIGTDPILNKILEERREMYGRGMAEGGEAIDDELAGMQMSEEDAMAEIQSIAPQTKMIEQLVMAVMQMVQQGIGEQEIINFLKEQGLDDEDIEDLFTMVMQQMQQGQQDPIASELQEMS